MFPPTGEICRALSAQDCSTHTLRCGWIELLCLISTLVPAQLVHRLIRGIIIISFQNFTLMYITENETISSSFSDEGNTNESAY